MNLNHLQTMQSFEPEDFVNNSSDGSGSQIETTLPLFMLSLFFAVIKRPWIIMMVILLVLIPLTFVLFSRVPLYQSSAKLMISTVDFGMYQNPGTIISGMYYSPTIKSRQYYETIGNSFEFKRNVRTRLTREFPNLDPDTIGAVVGAIQLTGNPREREFIMIQVHYPDPNLTYRATVIATEEYHSRCIDLEREDGNKILNFIETQIEQINRKLEQAEQELQSFLANNKFTLASENSNLTSELHKLENEHYEVLARLEMVQIDIKTYNSQIEQVMNDLSRSVQTDQIQGQMLSIQTSLDSIKAELAKLKDSDADKTRIQVLEEQRQDLLNQIIQTTTGPSSSEKFSSSDMNFMVSLTSLNKELQSAYLAAMELQNQVDYYQIQIDRFWEDHPELPKKILEYSRLKRTKEVVQRTADILVEKREEIRITIAGEQGGVKIIDSPEYPKQPIKEKKIAFIMIGFAFSIVLGIILSGIIDFFDNTVKDENDIRKLGVNTLGAIPVFPFFSNKGGKTGGVGKTEETRGRDMLIYESQKSYIAEAYRSLKISLQFAATDQGKNVFVVTSPGVGEGKSLTTANMGLVFAKSGVNTIVVDSDLRRSTLNRYFEISRKPGLTEHLLEGVELESIKRDTGFNNLTIITGGSSPPNPAELVSSRVMTDFVNFMRSEYDIVFIDSPPLLVCTDPISLGENSDGIIILIKMEYTNLKTLEYAINTIRKIGIEIMGVVMNHISYRYGTAYYYFYRYYRPYTYYSTYRYYSYYYGEYSKKTDAAKIDHRKKRRSKSED